MAKPISQGGKRNKQVKVNFNDSEYKKLDLLKEEMKIDRSNILRQCFAKYTYFNSEGLEIIRGIDRLQRLAIKNYSPIYPGIDKCIKELTQIREELDNFIKETLNLNELREEFREKIILNISKLTLLIEKICLIRDNLNEADNQYDEPLGEYITKLEELFLNSSLLKSHPNNSSYSVNNDKQKIYLRKITQTDHVYQVLDFLRDGSPVIVDLSKIESDDLISPILENLKVGCYALNSDNYLLSNNLIFYLPKGMTLDRFEFIKDPLTNIGTPTSGKTVAKVIKKTNNKVADDTLDKGEYLEKLGGE